MNIYGEQTAYNRKTGVPGTQWVVVGKICDYCGKRIDPDDEDDGDQVLYTLTEQTGSEYMYERLDGSRCSNLGFDMRSIFDKDFDYTYHLGCCKQMVDKYRDDGEVEFLFDMFYKTRLDMVVNQVDNATRTLKQLGLEED
jgi:hypothetical protein